MAAPPAPDDDAGDDTSRHVVVLYDFDPTTIEWPFQGQRPLPLVTGQVIQVVLDDGSDWALGHLKGRPDMRGYFPKNYTMTVTQYRQMMLEYEDSGGLADDADEVAIPEPTPGAASSTAAPRIEDAADDFAAPSATAASARSAVSGDGAWRRGSDAAMAGTARSADGAEPRRLAPPAPVSPTDAGRTLSREEVAAAWGEDAGARAAPAPGRGAGVGAMPASPSSASPSRGAAGPSPALAPVPKAAPGSALAPPARRVAVDVGEESMPLPPLSAAAPAFEPGRSRMARQMPPVPVLEPEEPEAEEDDILRAQREVEAELAAMVDPFQTGGGTASYSRMSTPATVGQSRADRDNIRTHMPMNLQQRYLRPVSHLYKIAGSVNRHDFEARPVYSVDMRVRSTTMRAARGIEPPHLRSALQNSDRNGARWGQMFRPGFNDLVNESMRTGCNACIVSDLYIRDNIAREQFQKMHVRDINGVLWFELQRRRDSVYYTRMDAVDVLMYHPDAWGCPDTTQMVSANPGEPIDPFHGWLAQGSVNAEKEMQDVDFLYTLRLRAFPEKTFQAISLGKKLEWQEDPSFAKLGAEDEPGVAKKAKAFEIDKKVMLGAGLEESDDVHVTIDKETGQIKGRSLAPDVLDTRITPFRIKGLSAMRIYLRSRGNPDNMKQTLITPKMVKDMAAQLGIRDKPGEHWYCLFAMRYPLPPEWEVVVRGDTRFYVHLPTDSMQPIHPMVKRFREHLDECIQNEFLWECRDKAVARFKCAECGMLDSIVWCMQCTDYFCAACFFKAHRTARGKKHWPMPIPGCRYLTASEAARLRDYLPLLNVGFSNRRRFLAREAGSDKNGSRQGDTWLFFHAETFQAALQQAPEKHWLLKRLKPPRLGPGAEGYYYNFANDVIADDASHILTKAHEQKALSLLQRSIRGAVVRRRIKKEIRAVVKIQGAKRMWDVRKLQGKNGANSDILKKWYGKHKAIQDREKLEHRISRVQAVFAGYEERRDFHQMISAVRHVQSKFRGIRARRRHQTLLNAVLCIQRQGRGRLYGRKPMREQHTSAALIQAMARGVARRELERRWARAARYVQAHARGMLCRLLVKRMRRMGIKIQSNWRRFQAQLDMKIILYERLQTLRQQRLELIREKMEGAAALLIQRNFRRHRDFQRCVYVKREKGEADKRIGTMFVAIMNAAASMRHFVHPYFRHLPKEIQEVLMQVKASMQRTIGLAPVTGKLASEELGRRGLRSDGAAGLCYDQSGRQDIDLASHFLLSVSRHLLSHLPADQFVSTVKWACYAIGHQACNLSSVPGTFAKEVVPVGKDPNLPAHPGDSLATLWEDVGTIKHHHDWLITTADESLPMLVLHSMPANHRHVYLTAEVLVTMRQALEAPSISTEDHLKFQGLDAGAGAQLMEVLSCELDHRMPLDWPKTHGTVSALAGQMMTHIAELKPYVKEEAPVELGIAPKPVEKASKPSSKAKSKGASKSKAKAKSKAGSKQREKVETVEENMDEPPASEPEGGQIMPPSARRLPDLPEGGLLSHFNRNATLRILQQLGYFMVGQDQVMKAVLGGLDATGTGAVRQSRYISVTDKLFEMADRATHDHCSFLLAVVLYHMALRSLMLRVLYHRAASGIQIWYRYIRNKGLKAHSIAPAIRIQRHWRGVRASLRLMRLDDAAARIQNSYRAWCWNRRSRALVAASLKVQRVWHSAVHRRWLRRCHGAAQQIQRFVRGMLTRWSLDPPGRELVRGYQRSLRDVMRQKSRMTETMYLARTATLAGAARAALHRHRQRNIDLHRMHRRDTRSEAARETEKLRRLRMKGAVQPPRLSIFEPMIFALTRLDQLASARYGAKNSRVLQQVDVARRKLLRDLPAKSTRVAPPHACSRRGRAAVATRRLVQKVGGATTTLTQPVHMLTEDEQFMVWHSKMFASTTAA